MRTVRDRSARLVAGLVLVAAAGALFLAGAAGAGELPEFTPEQMGGTLRRNFSAEPRTLNPLTSKDVYASIIQDHVLEALIERNPDTLEWEPLLAARWEISPDGKVITFHLDPRARFSDGRPVTAEDVVFTIETVRNPGIDCRPLASYYDDLERVEAVDERTVRFTWKTVYFKSFEVSGAYAPILPKHVYAFTDPGTFNDISRVLVGTGPYKLADWKTGEAITLVRSARYWRRPPAIERVVFRFILEEQAAVQAFVAGDLDYIALAPEHWLKLEKRPPQDRRYVMYKYSSPNGYRYVAWNNAHPIFGDARVRRAMTHLVWREKFIETMYHGLAEVVTGTFWPESPQYDRSLAPWPFDRQEALRLLAEAGWRLEGGWLVGAEGRRFAFELSATGQHQLTRDILRIMQEEFRRVGIDMSLRFYEWSVFTTKLDNHDYDAIMLGWSGTVEGDPYQIWHSSQIENFGSNHVQFRSAEADRLIEEARVTLDAGERNAIYHRFNRVLHEEQPYTFMWTQLSLAAVSSRVRGVRLHKLGLQPQEWWIPPEERLK